MRLERRVAQSDVLVDGNFNSIKVRLEQSKHLLNTQYHENFNSIKVRLELNLINKAKTCKGISIP